MTGSDDGSAGAAPSAHSSTTRLRSTRMGLKSGVSGPNSAVRTVSVAAAAPPRAL